MLGGFFKAADRAGLVVSRFTRLLVFGFEQLVLTRLIKRHRPIAETIAAAVLKTKGVEVAPPELERPSAEAWSKGFTAVNAALFLNLRSPDAVCPVRHALPAPPFRAVYLWDSAFIAQVWKWWDVGVAADVARATIVTREGDRLQHFVSEFARTPFTQPPLIAWSLARLAADFPEAMGPTVAEAYPVLAAYQSWLRAARCGEGGLYAWAHPYESGVENAPRFASRDERRMDDTRRRAAPDFCAYAALQLEALAAMARGLGLKEAAWGFAAERRALCAAVERRLWDEASGLYFDRDGERGGFIRTRTIASLLPLWAGIPSAERARRLVAHAMDPSAFGTLIPFPSVAVNDATFEPDMWRGPVWVNTAYGVLMGLLRYGYDAEAATLAWRLIDGVFQTYSRHGHFYEFYDPASFDLDRLHRKRGNTWKRWTLGDKPVADFVGWTGLVDTLVIELLFGLHRAGRGYRLRPRFPEAAWGQRFVLTVPQIGTRIELQVGEGGSVTGEIASPGGTCGVRARFGDTAPFPGDRA